MSAIFLSYASEDRERVEPLVRLLETVAPVWWDPKIRHGSRFDAAIEAALSDAKCVVVVWSRSSIESNWVKAEADEGLSRGILVPVMIDPVRLPLAFRQIEAAQLQEWNGTPDHSEAALLLSSVRHVLVPSPAVDALPASASPLRGSLHRASKPGLALIRKRVVSIAAVMTVVSVLVFGLTWSEELTAFLRDRDPELGTENGSSRTPGPRQVTVIVLSETATPSLESAIRFLSQDSLRRGYHYLVAKTGAVHSLYNEKRPARHTTGFNQQSIGIGLVHMSRAVATQLGHPYQPYPDVQLDSLVKLLTELVREYELDVVDIRSKQELNERYPREITDHMTRIRAAVGRELAARRLPATDQPNGR